MGRRKATVSEADPLLKAIIGKLPAAGTGWPAEQREAWLHMVEIAFEVVYGPAEVTKDMTASEAARVMDRSGDPKAMLSSFLSPTAHAGFDYYIDTQGHARDAIDDAPVSIAAVGDEMIYDYRRGPARDRDTIIWADGSIGARPGMNFCGPG